MHYHVWALTTSGITQVALTRTVEDAKKVADGWDRCYIIHDGDMIFQKNLSL